MRGKWKSGVKKEVGIPEKWKECSKSRPELRYGVSRELWVISEQGLQELREMAEGLRPQTTVLFSVPAGVTGILGKTRRTHLGISQGSLNPLFVGRSSCPQGLEGQSPSSEEINHSNRSVTWQLTQGS